MPDVHLTCFIAFWHRILLNLFCILLFVFSYFLTMFVFFWFYLILIPFAVQNFVWKSFKKRIRNILAELENRRWGNLNSTQIFMIHNGLLILPVFVSSRLAFSSFSRNIWISPSGAILLSWSVKTSSDAWGKIVFMSKLLCKAISISIKK